jgi:hypothetical protein
LPYHPDRIGRTNFQHHLIADMFEMLACDDDVTVNTQATSQWDGLSLLARYSFCRETF